MELSKTLLHQIKLGHSTFMQLTLDDDFNIPDTKPDALMLMREHATVTILENKCNNGKLRIKGNLNAVVLFASDSDPVDYVSHEVSIPFDELMYLENYDSGEIQLTATLEDITASLVHPKKINVKALVNFEAHPEELFDISAVSSASGDEICSRILPLRAASLFTEQKTTVRLKDTLVIPPSMPEIRNILYHETDIHGFESHAVENGIKIKGMMNIFYIYKSSDNTIVPVSTMIPFERLVEVPGTSVAMSDNSTYELIIADIQPIPDTMGEYRMAESDVSLELTIRLYEEKEFPVLCDAYATNGTLAFTYNQSPIQKLFPKYTSVKKISGKYRLPSVDETLLQIYHTSGRIHVDTISLSKGVLKAQGSIELLIFAQNDSDRIPYSNVKVYTPFESITELNELNDNCSYRLNFVVNDIIVTVSAEDEVSWSLEYVTGVTAFIPSDEKVIEDISFQPFTKADISEFPGITGYFVQKDDTLWNIGKSFHLSAEEICKINNLEQNTPLTPGTPLILPNTGLFQLIE